MSKEIITQKQGIVMMVTFILGSTLVLGAGNEAKQDVWLAILLSMAMAVPACLVYIRLLTIFPGKGLYEVLIKVFGGILGRIMAIPFIWFVFHLGSLVIRNFTEFITVVSIPETPEYIIAIFMAVLCIWAVKAGIEVIGRWTSITLPILIIVILAVTFLFAGILKFENLKPVLVNGMAPVLNTAFSVFAFPFAETVIFTTVLNKLRQDCKPHKVYFWSLLIGGSIIFLVSVRSLLSLGEGNILILYFPSYASVRLINIGNFLQRIEVSVTMVFIISGFVKISICLYSACTGIAKILGSRDYRWLVAPIGLSMVILSLIIYNDTVEMFEWASKIFKYYAFPFEVVLPVIILIAAEIKVRSVRKRREAVK